MNRIVKEKATVPLFFAQTLVQSLRDVGYNHALGLARSRLLTQEFFLGDGIVPAGQQPDAALHAAETRLAWFLRRQRNLGHGEALAGDDHLFSILDGPDQFGQAILRFRGADFHVSDYKYFVDLTSRNSSSSRLDSLGALFQISKNARLLHSLPSA
jgi:hypothetical protein